MLLYLSLIHILLNVLTGERYKMITNESKALLRGEYGQTVKPMNKEVQKKAIGDEKPITCRPADLLEPELSKIEAEMSQWKEQDEDVLTLSLIHIFTTIIFNTFPASVDCDAGCDGCH